MADQRKRRRMLRRTPQDRDIVATTTVEPAPEPAKTRSAFDVAIAMYDDMKDRGNSTRRAIEVAMQDIMRYVRKAYPASSSKDKVETFNWAMALLRGRVKVAKSGGTAAYHMFRRHLFGQDGTGVAAEAVA